MDFTPTPTMAADPMPSDMGIPSAPPVLDKSNTKIMKVKKHLKMLHVAARKYHLGK